MFENDLSWMLDTPKGKEIQRYPLTNISVDEKEDIVIEIAVAGFGMDCLDIELEGDTLVINGTLEDEAQNRDYIQKHISTQDFTRKVRLDKDYISGDITADLTDGILTIVITKKEKDRKIISIS